jgi:hypothetical protein
VAPRTIPIPSRLENILDQDETTSAKIKSSLAEYSSWLKESRLFFFPEYTDHGPKHIADVLDTSDGLITDDAIQLLSPADVGALVLAVLLHDVPMHLSKDGLLRLVLGKTSLNPITELGDAEWPVLWDPFRTEAIRFSPIENIRLFGNPQPAHFPSITDWDWREKQVLLGGEFIRRNHSRLAHQIAIKGFPGAESEELQLTLEGFQADLVGLVARSHGMPLRPCI